MYGEAIQLSIKVRLVADVEGDHGLGGENAHGGRSLGHCQRDVLGLQEGSMVRGRGV